MAEYKLITTEGRAKRGEFKTVHGTIQTPVFMNVGTIAAIKGAVSTVDLHEIGTQVELSLIHICGCRASNYIAFIRRALKKAGMEQIPVISLNLSGLESNPGFKLTLPLIRRIVYGAVFGDILMKCCLLYTSRCV